GTVDIGGVNSNTPTLRRQILNGATADDLAYYGGRLALDASGELKLSGDPGLKLGVLEPELRKVMGQCRYIFLYRAVERSGNQAEFTVVGFAAARILAVELTGSTRYVQIQPCGMIC